MKSENIDKEISDNQTILTNLIAKAEQLIKEMDLPQAIGALSEAIFIRVEINGLKSVKEFKVQHENKH